MDKTPRIKASDSISLVLRVKPLSVNEAWQGRRFKTEKYKSFEKLVLLSLQKMKIPDGELTVRFTFGFSNKASDLDNPVKPLMDCLQKKYGFNDSRVYKLIVEKQIVPKGKEFFSFTISKFAGK